MADFHFLRPWMLLAIVPLAWVVWRMVYRHVHGGSWENICDKALLPFMLLSGKSRSSKLPIWLFAWASVIIVLALAGPSWKQMPSSVFNNTRPLIIVLDVSRSMNAIDLQPSRIDRARYKISDLLQRRKEGQTGLVVFAGVAFVITPLTQDVGTLLHQMQNMSPDIMPSQGSNVASGLRQALVLLKNTNIKSGDVLLLADGVGGGNALAEATRIKKAGYKLFVLAVGTTAGGIIRDKNGKFFAHNGATVRPRLIIEPLQALAAAGGGKFAMMTVDNVDIDSLLPVFKMNDGLATKQKIKAQIWLDEGPLLLFLLLPLALFAFRRGWILLVVILVMPLQDPVVAASWSSYVNSDQEAYQQFKKGNFKKAAALFKNENWKAVSLYRLGQFKEAIQIWERKDSIFANYNRGNALASLKQCKNALDAYERVLQLSPDHNQAQHNRTEMIMCLEKKARKKGQGQKGKGQKGQSQQGQSQQGQGQQGQGQQGQGQQGQGQQGQGQQGQGQQGQGQQGKQSDKTGKNGQKNTANGQNGKPGQGNKPNRGMSAKRMTEAEQAYKQWLRQVPENPGGLWREKFKRQYRRQYYNNRFKNKRSRSSQPW